MADFNKDEGNWGRDANVKGTAKAWAKFNGSGTIHLSGSYNVTSITDTAVGRYKPIFTNFMVDKNFTAVLANGDNSVNTNRNVWNTVVNQEISAFEINVYNEANFDPDNVYFVAYDS